jgi:hypothetical protein
MKTLSTISAAVVGTTAMTLFSFLFSKKKNYSDQTSEVKKEKSRLGGWQAHYVAGMLYASAYDKVWENTLLKPSILSGALLGAASGMVGVAGWSQMLNISDPIPAGNEKKYYRHLVAAHIVFGIGAAIGYKLFDGHNRQEETESINNESNHSA